jgi:peptide/nickel transport system permease protein
LNVRRPGIRGIKRGQPGLIAGSVILAAVVAGCVLVPIIDSNSSDALVALPFQHPSLSYPFGTDDVGRDVFVRTFAGGRLDLAIAAVVVGASFAIGTLLGVVTATTRLGWLDRIIVRVIDAFIAFPFVILVLAVIVVIGLGRSLWVLPSGVPAIIVAMIVVDWTVYARLARAEALTLRGRDYVLAARLLGFRQRRIVLRHVLPGVLRVTAAYAISDVVLIVIVTASLSFLGVGVQPPTAEWGSIMFEGRAVLSTAWWVTTAPGAVLATTGLALSVVADGLFMRDRSRA